MKVVPASHREGVLSPQCAQAVRAERGEVAAVAPRGAALLMRPLLLHASSKSSGTSRRRVLHLLFGPPQLPLGLQWAHRV